MYSWDDGKPSNGDKLRTIYSSYGEILRNNLQTVREEYDTIRESAKRQSDYKITAEEHKLHNGTWDWNSYVLKGKRQSKDSHNLLFFVPKQLRY